MFLSTARARANAGSPAGVNGLRPSGHGLAVNTSLSHFTGDGQQLSGGANAFEPGSAGTSNNRYLLRDSVPDDGPVIVRSPPAVATNSIAARSPAVGASAQQPVGTRTNNSLIRRKMLFTTDMGPGVPFLGGHYVKIEVAADKYAHLSSELMAKSHWSAKVRRWTVMSHDAEDKQVIAFVAFDDVRAADKAHDEVSVIESTASVSWLGYAEYENGILFVKKEEVAASPTHCFDGQVIFTADFDGPVTESKVEPLSEAIRKLASTFGDILVMDEMNGVRGTARFRVEYHSIATALKVCKLVTPAAKVTCNGWSISTRVYGSAESDGRATPVAAGNNETTTVSPTGRTEWVTNEATGKIIVLTKNGTGRFSPADGHMARPKSTRHDSDPFLMNLPIVPQRGFTTAPLPPLAPLAPLDIGNPVAFQNGRSQSQSQTVNLANIQNGHDVRTTVMLRNLPHSMTCHRLKQILDVSSFGKYDFSYVRIDYTRSSSVGYGFVNFIQPQVIIEFINTFRDTPWMPELRDGDEKRRAEMSYAAVQGYDCCVDRFRNSSVLDECPDYRPKLWFTHTSAPNPSLVGTEAPFPPVNNHSKHARSRANASQVGLFPPQHRRGLLGGQRGFGRSQYDRGTTAQKQEDYIFQMNQMQYAPTMYPHHMQYAVAGGQMPFMPGMPGQAVTQFGYPNQNAGMMFGQMNPPHFDPRFAAGNGMVPNAHVNGIANGMVPNAHVNGIANGMVPNAHVNGIANGMVPNAHVNGIANGMVPNAHVNGMANGYFANGHANGYLANGHVNGIANVQANGQYAMHQYANGHNYGQQANGRDNGHYGDGHFAADHHATGHQTAVHDAADRETIAAYANRYSASAPPQVNSRSHTPTTPKIVDHGEFEGDVDVAALTGYIPSPHNTRAYN